MDLENWWLIFFNGNYSKELHPQTIRQSGTLQKIAFDLEGDTKIFEIILIEASQTTTYAIDFLKHTERKVKI